MHLRFEHPTDYIKENMQKSRVTSNDIISMPSDEEIASIYAEIEALSNRVPYSVIATKEAFFVYRLPNYSQIKEQELIQRQNAYNSSKTA